MNLQMHINVSHQRAPEMAETSDISNRPGGPSPHSTGTVTSVPAGNI